MFPLVSTNELKKKEGNPSKTLNLLFFHYHSLVVKLYGVWGKRVNTKEKGFFALSFVYFYFYFDLESGMARFLRNASSIRRCLFPQLQVFLFLLTSFAFVHFILFLFDMTLDFLLEIRSLFFGRDLCGHLKYFHIQILGSGGLLVYFVVK